jgi:hypothetical protein
MREIITTIDIGASPERVWRVLTDFASYPKWNPFLRGVHGSLEQGARLRVRMRMRRRGRARIISPTVSKVIPAAELRWRGKLFIKGLFDGEHMFIIVAQGLEGTRFIQRKRFSGLLVPLLMPFIVRKTYRSFEAMNRALKKVAEVKS